MNSPALEVLVIEPDAAVAAAIAAALRRRGHCVSTAASDREALEFPTPQALVCDGGPSGFELLEALARRGALVHAVLLAGEPTLEDCRRALRLGAAEYLDRPCPLGDIVAAVESGRPAGPLPAPVPAREATWTFERRTLATLGNVERCVRELAAFLMRVGLGPTTRARVATAVAEVLDNAQRHAYDDQLGHVSVEARLAGKDLVVAVSDEGCGFEPLNFAASPGRSTLDGGLARVDSLAEELRVESVRGRGTCVSLRFSAFPVAFGGAGELDLSDLDFLSPELSRRMLERLRDGDLDCEIDLSPALAVTVGRLLTGGTERQSVQRALWS